MKKIIKYLSIVFVLLFTLSVLFSCTKPAQNQENVLQIQSIYQDALGELNIVLVNNNVLDESIGQYMEISINNGEWHSTSDYGNNQYRSVISLYESLLKDLVGESISIDARIAEFTSKNVVHLASSGLAQKIPYVVKESLLYSTKPQNVGIMNPKDWDPHNLVDYDSTEIQPISDISNAAHLKYIIYDGNDIVSTEWYDYVIIKNDAKLFIKKISVLQETESFSIQFADVEPSKFSIVQSAVTSIENRLESESVEYYEEYSWINVTSSGVDVSNFNTISGEEDGNEMSIISFYLRLNPTDTATEYFYNYGRAYNLYL